MEEVSIKELFFILAKRKKVIFLLTVVSILTSGIVSFFILTPEYETFTTLMVGKPRDYGSSDSQLDYNDVLLNQKLVPTYGQLVKSRLVTDEVIKNLELDLTPKEFEEKVNVNLVNDTEIIKVEVVDEDPKLAVAISNETAEVFMKTVKEKMKVENVQVIDRAQEPEKPIKPRPKLNMAIAGVLGFMISIFIIFLIEYLDSTIKTPDDVEKYLDLPIIGTIPNVED